MAVFRLPDLGEGLTEAALVRWLVAEGDTVVTDQPIAEVETAKSVVEVPSPYAGVVAVRHGAEGDVLAVGSPLLEVTEVGDTAKEAYRDEERAGSGNVLIGYGTSGSHATTRTRRKRAGVSTASRPAAPSGPVAVRSPIVRRLAQERGIDLRSVTPTGPGGLITRADVLGVVSVSISPGPDVVRTERLSMLRRTVAAKMTRSRTEIPEATVWVEVDATELWDARAAMAEPRPSLTALIGRFVLDALAEFPVLCARLSADGTAIEHLDGVHLGVAADTERGLMVPVVRHAEGMSVGELDTAIRAAAGAARSGAATPADLTGSTFTLNNYGSLGVDGSAAIINHPEVAILGVGRLIEKPWVVDGAIVARRILTLSLVFDHRVCDGGYASGFLRKVVGAIEHPAS
jgi:2-oxoisovalerate dehydrogenase E2 component (dihydrolipoyl transacylase)